MNTFDTVSLRVYAELKVFQERKRTLTDIAALQKNLGVSFKDKSLLNQALVHSSYSNENPEIASSSNERLEFLGDAVLGLIVAEKMYRDFPDFTEGKIGTVFDGGNQHFGCIGDLAVADENRYDGACG